MLRSIYTAGEGAAARLVTDSPASGALLALLQRARQLRPRLLLALPVLAQNLRKDGGVVRAVRPARHAAATGAERQGGA